MLTMNKIKRDARGNSVFHNAAIKGDIDTLRDLIKKYPNNIEDRNSLSGFTPLHFAAKCNQVEALQILINEGRADVSSESYSGQRALHIAAKFGCTDAVRVLINEGNANISELTGNDDDDCYTPLQLAICNNRIETVQVLLEEYNADPSKKSLYGKTPLELTSDNNSEIKGLIMRNLAKRVLAIGDDTHQDHKKSYKRKRKEENVSNDESNKRAKYNPESPTITIGFNAQKASSSSLYEDTMAINENNVENYETENAQSFFSFDSCRLM